VKLGELLGGHGVVLTVADPESAAREWRRALNLRELRRSRGEIVLGSVAFFVVLRRSTRGSGLAEVHVAVEDLKGPGLRSDRLGGRSRARDLEGVRLVVRELVEAPSRAWVRKRGRRR
jgi:hypothetical protein